MLSAIVFIGATKENCLFLSHCQTASKYCFSQPMSLLFPDPGSPWIKRRNGRSTSMPEGLLLQVSQGIASLLVHTLPSQRDNVY